MNALCNAVFITAALFVIAGSASDQSYNFGFDDGFYYSYLPSVLIDHDLDLSNQYERIQFPPDILARKTPLGLVRNEFPIGPAILWSPFFAVGHLVSRLLGYISDGYSAPYMSSVILGNTLYCFAGLYCIYLSLAKFFSKALAVFSTMALWMATPIFVYSTRVFLVSETVSMFIVSVVVWLVVSGRNRSHRQLIVLGLCCALAIMVRLHNVVFLLVPLLSLWKDSSGRSPKETLLCHVSLFAGIAVGFLPQLVVWKGLYGSWIINPGQYLLWWREPRVLELLFSARKGLFTWSPLLVLSVAGLIAFYRRGHRFWALCFLSLFLANVYINAAQWDWWGATSFGARRFTNCLLIFAFGLAALIPRFSVKRLQAALVIALVVLLIPLNLYLGRSYRRGRLQYDHADRFTDVLNKKFYPAYLPIVYGMQFPVQMAYHLKYGIPLYGPENEFFIGDDIVYFQERHGNLLSGLKNPIFGDGWSAIENPEERRRICSSGDCTTNLPLFFKYETDLRLTMALQPLEMESKEATLTIYFAGYPVMTRNIGSGETTIKLPLYKYYYPKQVTPLRMTLTDPAGVRRPFLLNSFEFLARESRRPAGLTQ